MLSLQERLHGTIDKYEAKDFDYFLKGLDGISAEQVKQHYQLYERYINKVNEINEKLKSADKATANSTYSEYRGLKVELTFALDAVLLHELYFSNIIGRETRPMDSLKAVIERDFGNWDNYLADIEACGQASRGWVITGYNYRDGKVQNFIIDSHNLHVPLSVRPILVMDMWEHAYMIDHGIDKSTYIKAFCKNINWPVVSLRLEAALKSHDQFKETEENIEGER